MELRPIAPSGEEPNASFLQSEQWAAFKAAFGWRPLRFSLEFEGRAAALSVLIRRLPAGFCFAYLPHGPEADPRDGNRAAMLAGISEALRPFLPKACLFIRYDPPWFETEERGADAGDEAESSPGAGDSVLGGRSIKRPEIGRPLRKAAYDVQPPDTVLIDLGQGEEDILAGMKPKWRYNIRLAERKGVTVEESGAEAIPAFYELYRATSARDRIAIHPESYYRRLFDLAARGREGEPDGRAFDLRLWIARHEGRPLAAIITLFYGGQGVYLYGASSDEGRSLMPAYALQWSAMRAAKAGGCSSYDLFGIPPSGDPDHPMAGLYRFKTGFGGAIAHRAGSWDYPLLRPAYACFRAAEGARAWWYKDLKKKLGRGSRKAK